MNPKRILLPIAIALAAIACTAPAAQADVSLSDSKGTLKAGALVTATSTNLKTTRPDGTRIECAKATLQFELDDPGPTHLELEQIGSALLTQGCIFNREAIEQPNLPLTIFSGTIGVGEGGIMTIDTWGTATTNFTIVDKIFADAAHTILVANCDFVGALHFEAAETTGDELTVTPSTLNGGTCGEVDLHADFTLATPNGDPIFIHYDATP